MNSFPGVFNRRSFCAVTGTATLASLTSFKAPMAAAENSENATGPRLETGNGEWTYKVVPDWDKCPLASHSAAHTAPLPRTVRARYMSARRAKLEF